MTTITLDNASLAVQADARYDLIVFGPDGREHHITGYIPPSIRDVHLSRGVFQAMANGVLRLYYPESNADTESESSARGAGCISL